MATDGIKIVDSDIAHDTYSSIFGLFEEGLNRDAVLQQIPFKRQEYGFDEDYFHELFVTSYALAFWEIGWLTKEIIEEVENVISKGASVESWADEFGTRAGKSRQNVLNKFWIKINSINPRLRKVRKYKQKDFALFSVDDLLTYKKDNGIYRVLICANVEIYRGKICYSFVPTSYFGNVIPTIEEIIKYGIYGVRIGVSGDLESVSLSQEGVSELWDLFSENTFIIQEKAPFIIGLVKDLVQHKDILQFKDKLIPIGKLKIKKQFNKQGSGMFSTTFDQFDKNEQLYIDLRYKVFPIRILCEL